LILLLLNFSTREKEKSPRGAPALSAWRRGPLFQWACRKSQPTWMARRDATPDTTAGPPRPGRLLPRASFQFSTARAGGRDARLGWWSGAECGEGRKGETTRDHRSPRPNPPLGLGRSPAPAATTFRAFSLYPPAKIINQRPHRTGTRLTHRPTSTAPQPGLEGGEWRASAGSAPHPRSRPSPPPGHVRHFSVIRLPGPGVGDQTETNAPRRAGRAAGRGRAGRDASHARRPDPDSGDAPRWPRPVGMLRHHRLYSLARCQLSASVRER